MIAINVMNKKLNDIAGAFLGVILFYIWVFILYVLTFRFFSHREAINNTIIATLTISPQVLTWLIAGSLPFFVIFGHYITTRDEKDRCMLKCTFLGFIAWLFITIAFSSKMTHSINIAGGYLATLLIYTIKMKALRMPSKIMIVITYFSIFYLLYLGISKIIPLFPSIGEPYIKDFSRAWLLVMFIFGVTIVISAVLRISIKKILEGFGKK